MNPHASDSRPRGSHTSTAGETAAEHARKIARVANEMPRRNTEQEIRAAQRFVAGRSGGASECRVLLEALGLMTSNTTTTTAQEIA